jgi:hypothetical protein
MSTRWANGGVGFFSERIDGLLDQACSGRPRSINDDEVAAVIERTLQTMPTKDLQ